MWSICKVILVPLDWRQLLHVYRKKSALLWPACTDATAAIWRVFFGATNSGYCTLFRTGRPVWYNKLVVLTEKRPGWDNPGLLVLLLLVQLASSYLSSASAIVFVLEIIAWLCFHGKKASQKWCIKSFELFKWLRKVARVLKVRLNTAIWRNLC